MVVGATFDRSLMRRFGDAMGMEYYKKGINVALLPVAGPLGRVARGGRNWEGYELEDTYHFFETMLTTSTVSFAPQSDIYFSYRSNRRWTLPQIVNAIHLT